MSAYLLFDGETVNLAKPTPAQYNALWNLYNTWKRRPGHHMPLICTRPHGGPMHLRVIAGRLWVAHYPGYGDPSCNQQLSEPESPAHHHMKEYGSRAAEAAGFTVTPEYATGNSTRVDLYVQAPFPYGIEAQLSPISDREVKTRTTKSTRAGVPPVWVATEDRTYPFAPNIGFNREIDWEPAVPPRGTVIALHMRHITRERCTAASRWYKCPEGKRHFCGEWHPWFDDVLRGWTLDDALAGIGNSALVFHQDKRGNVRVVLADDLPIYLELTGHDGAFSPGGVRAAKPNAAQPNDGQARECTAARPVYTTARPAYTTARPVYKTCALCPQALWAPESRRRGVCEGCWRTLQHDGKSIELASTSGESH